MPRSLTGPSPPADLRRPDYNRRPYPRDQCETIPPLAGGSSTKATRAGVTRVGSCLALGSCECSGSHSRNRPDPTSTALSEHPDFGMVAGRVRGLRPDGLPRYVGIPRQPFMTPLVSTQLAIEEPVFLRTSFGPVPPSNDKVEAYLARTWTRLSLLFPNRVMPEKLCKSGCGSCTSSIGGRAVAGSRVRGDDPVLSPCRSSADSHSAVSSSRTPT
jgi:hypothetical protein